MRDGRKVLARPTDRIPNHLTTTYTYDGEDIVLQTESDGTTTTATQFVHGLGIDEPLAMVRDGQNFFYHADGLGSIVAISDSAQTVVARYSYDAFGMVTASDPGFANAYAYTGREWDKELGLYYYRARYYDPMEGRFISKDPISFAGGDVNVYRYVQNDPINFIDPDGKFAVIPVALFIAKYGGSIIAISKVVGFFQDNYYDSQLLRQIQGQEDWVVEQMKKTNCDEIERYDYLNDELERLKSEERKIMVRLGYGVVSASHKSAFKIRKLMGE